MSHPDPKHDPENVMSEDRYDYQQQQEEDRRRREEEREQRKLWRETWDRWAKQTTKENRNG